MLEHQPTGRAKAARHESATPMNHRKRVQRSWHARPIESGQARRNAHVPRWYTSAQPRATVGGMRRPRSPRPSAIPHRFCHGGRCQQRTGSAGARTPANRLCESRPPRVRETDEPQETRSALLARTAHPERPSAATRTCHVGTVCAAESHGTRSCRGLVGHVLRRVDSHFAQLPLVQKRPKHTISLSIAFGWWKTA